MMSIKTLARFVLGTCLVTLCVSPGWGPGLIIGLSGGAANAAGATPARFGGATCIGLRAEQQKFIETGILADFQRGPEWAKANASPERLREIEAYIRLDEDVKFGCRDAVLSPDAELARDAAKRLELDPNADPTAAPQVKTGATPPALPKADTGEAGATLPKIKPRKPKQDAERDPAKPGADKPALKPTIKPSAATTLQSHQDGTADASGKTKPPSGAAAASDSGSPPMRRWVPIGDANVGIRP